MFEDAVTALLGDDSTEEPLFVPEGDVSWMQFGLCAQTDPGLFYPEFQGSKTCNTARQICASCEVREPCLEYALQFPESQDWGVWGGTTAVERADIRRLRNGEEVVIRLANLLPRPASEADYLISDLPDPSDWDLDQLEAELNLLAG